MSFPPYRTRRRVLLRIATSAAVVASPWTRVLAGDELLEEDDPLALSVGYVKDAATVDLSKSPTYRPGQVCAGCVWYQGVPEATAGPCQLFGSKFVMTRGWCRAWGLKPETR